MKVYLLLAAIAMALTILLTPAVRWACLRFGIVPALRGRDLQKTPIPRLGGIAMTISLIVTMLVASRIPYMAPLFTGTIPWAVMAGAGGMCILGIIDDIIELDWMAKLGGQVLIAGGMAFGGVQLASFPIFGITLGSSRLSLFISVLFIVGIMNAVNFIDGLDGLASGMIAIGAGGQAVEPVDEIDGVHDADDEEDGDEEPQARGTERQAENRERGQLHASEGHAAGDQDLAAELSHPVQFDNVVNDAEDAHGAGTGHDGPWDCCRKQGRHVGDARGDEHRHDQRDGHCDTAQARDRCLLKVAAAQRGQDVEAQARPANDRGEQNRQSHRNGTEQQVDLHALPPCGASMDTSAAWLRSSRLMVPRRMTRGVPCAQSTMDEAVDPFVGPASR